MSLVKRNIRFEIHEDEAGVFHLLMRANGKEYERRETFGSMAEAQAEIDKLAQVIKRTVGHLGEVEYESLWLYQ